MSELSFSELNKSALLRNSDSQVSQSLLAKESQVLLGGFSEGAKAAAKSSFADLQTFEDGLLQAPKDTVSKYASEHWQEAATAAALTVLFSKKLAATAIGLWSMKGIAESTYDAAKMAASPLVPMEAAKDIYAQDIAEQGRALINSLPMTLAGASAGRLGANLFLGKGLSASDAISGKINRESLESNFYNKMDQIRRPAVKLLVTDMDNTLLSTQKQQALGLQEAMQELSAKTKIPAPELYERLGTVMEKYHSHSYPWTLELALKDKLKIGEADGISIKEFNEKIAEPFWNTVDDSMKHLELYPGVRSTLDMLAQKNIPVAVLSDASASSGLRRFLHLDLDRAPIDRLYTLRNPSEPAELPESLRLAGRERLKQALSKEHGLKEFQVLPREWEKPSAGGLEAIIDKYGVRPSQVLMVGDSVRRDMGVAANTGSRGLHANYVESEPQYEAIMNRFKDPNVKLSFKDKTQEKIPFEDHISSYAEIPKYLSPQFKPLAIPHIVAESSELALTPPMVLYQQQKDVD